MKWVSSSFSLRRSQQTQLQRFSIFFSSIRSQLWTFVHSSDVLTLSSTDYTWWYCRKSHLHCSNPFEASLYVLPFTSFSTFSNSWFPLELFVPTNIHTPKCYGRDGLCKSYPWTCCWVGQPSFVLLNTVCCCQRRIYVASRGCLSGQDVPGEGFNRQMDSFLFWSHPTSIHHRCSLKKWANTSFNYFTLKFDPFVLILNRICSSCNHFT